MKKNRDGINLKIPSNTLFFIATGVLTASLFFHERGSVQYLLLLLSFLSAGFLLKRKVLYFFLATLVFLFLAGLRDIAENEDRTINIIKKLFLFSEEEHNGND